jgi:hypothetical protein
MYSQGINLKRYNSDDLGKKTNWKNVVIAPVTLISLGLISTADNEGFSKYEIEEERNENLSHFHTHADDYLQFAPIAAVYALNLFGVQGEHDFLNRTVLLIKSELIMTAIVVPLKHLTAVPRPDTGAPNSFPSGHAAQAFAGATFLHKEFGKDHPWYSVAAYATATGVGIFRVLNNRHWVSDVLVGAGIGILSTNLAYLTHKKHWGGSQKNKTQGLLITPTYGHRSFGMYLSLAI